MTFIEAVEKLQKGECFGIKRPHWKKSHHNFLIDSKGVIAIGHIRASSILASDWEIFSREDMNKW